MIPLPLLTLQDWIDALAGPRATPAGGSLALATLAGASAVSAKVLRARGRDGSLFADSAQDFLLAAEEDAEAYARAVREKGAAVAECLEAGARHLESALALLDALRRAFEDLPTVLAADLAAAEGLAGAGARALLVNLAVNLSEWSEAVQDPAALERLRRFMDAARISLKGP